MNRFSRILAVGLAVVLVAGGLYASNFRVADTVYMLGAIYSQGATAFYDTDAVVWNPNDVSVDVQVAYMPTGNVDNRNLTNVKSVGTIPAHGVLELDHIVKDTFGISSGFGHLLFFSCKTGGDCSNCDSNPADCAGIAVEGRVYSFNPNVGTDSTRATSGQLFNGYPWFSYASTDESARGLDQIWIMGLRQDGLPPSVTTGYHTNIGLVNSSQFSSTTLRVTLYNDSDGSQYGTPYQITLNPLGHVQIGLAGNAQSMFPNFTGRGYVKVEQIAFTPTGDPDYPDGAPGFFAYGAAIDNQTSDPTTLEPIFPTSDPYLQVFAAGKGSTTTRSAVPVPERGVRRPAAAQH